MTGTFERLWRIEQTGVASRYIGITEAFYVRYTMTITGLTGMSFSEVELLRRVDGELVVVNEIEKVALGDRGIRIDVTNIRREQTDTEFDLYIRKTDEEGARITDNSAEFAVTRIMPGDIPNINKGTHETTSEGTIRLENIQTTCLEEEIIFRIEETSAPYGYERIVNAFYVRVKTDIVGGHLRIVEINGVQVGRMEEGDFIPDPVNGVTALLQIEHGDVECDDVYDTGEYCECLPAILETVQVDVENKRIVPPAIFNLALRTFIGEVETNGVVDILNRAPVVSMPSVFTGELIYTFPVDKSVSPVQMTNGSIMIQTIRIFNEGTIAGYVNDISNDIPAGLEFLPMHNTNVSYEWVMYDVSGQVTADVSEAVEIRTRYLENNQIDAFDPDLGVIVGNPDYRDIQVAFRVTYEGGTGRIIVSRSEIIDAEAFGGGTVGYINLLDEENDTEYMYVVRTDIGNNNNNNNNDDDGEVKGEYRPENNNQGKGNAVSTADDTNMFKYKVLASIAMVGLLAILILKEKRS